MIERGRRRLNPDTYLEFAAPLAVGAGVRSDLCDFWDTFAG
jgi:hypothetical protein